MSNRNLILAGTAVLTLLIIAAAMPADSTKGQSQTQPKTQTQPQSQPQTEVTVRYDVMFQGTFSGLKDPLQEVIQNKKDFEDLWKKHVSVLVPQPPVPEVDFNTSVVVAIAIGEKVARSVFAFEKSGMSTNTRVESGNRSAARGAGLVSMK